MQKKKVIIIGAGPAGLTMAYELLKNKSDEYEVSILVDKLNLENKTNLVILFPIVGFMYKNQK